MRNANKSYIEIKVMMEIYYHNSKRKIHPHFKHGVDYVLCLSPEKDALRLINYIKY